MKMPLRIVLDWIEAGGEALKLQMEPIKRLL